MNRHNFACVLLWNQSNDSQELFVCLWQQVFVPIFLLNISGLPTGCRIFLWCLFHSLTISWQVTKYVSKWVIQPIHSFNFFSSIFIYFILLRKTFKETTSVQIHFLCSLIPSIASENEDYKSGKYSTSWTEVQHIFSVCLFGNI